MKINLLRTRIWGYGTLISGMPQKARRRNGNIDLQNNTWAQVTPNKAHNRHGTDEDYATVLPLGAKTKQALGRPPMLDDAVTSAPLETSGEHNGHPPPTPSNPEVPGRKHPPTVNAIGTDPANSK